MPRLASIVTRTALAAALLVTGVAAAPAPAPASGGLSWGACPKAVGLTGEVPVPADMQCAPLAVPLDWTRPSGARLQLQVARLPALDPGSRIGTLVFNIGGPGASAVAGLAATASRFATLRSRFDVVSFDPRGVGPAVGGLSTPSISCQGAEPPELLPDRFVDSRADFQRAASENQAFARQCLAGSDGLLAHLGSTSDARDVEAVRRALGEDRITLYGNSGSTPIMERYAELYPGHVRALYLDSVLDYGAGSRATNLAIASAFESGFHAFVAWCQGSAACALHGQDPVAAWEQLAAAADRQPIPAPEAHTTVDGDTLRAVALIAGTGGDMQDWPAFSQAVVQAANGDASWFATFLPQLFDLPPIAFGAVAAQQNILCANGYSRVASYAELQREQRDARSVAPEVGWFALHWSSIDNVPVNCQGFPAPVDPPRPVRWKGSFPVLVVNDTLDTGTPHALAAAVQRQIPHSVLVTVDGKAHAAYLDGTSSCVNAAVERYLFERRLPAPRTVCELDLPVVP